MNQTEINRLCSELMERSSAVYLTTIEPDGFPQTRAMLNLRNPRQYPDLVNLFSRHRDDFRIYFTTNTSSLKVEQIKANPAVCAYFCIPEEWRGLMVKGYIESESDPGIKNELWQKGWEMYYPGGPTDPDYTILTLRPISGKGYHQLNFFNLSFGETP